MRCRIVWVGRTRAIGRGLIDLCLKQQQSPIEIQDIRDMANKLPMKLINEIWRKETGRPVNGVSLSEKCDVILKSYSQKIPKTKAKKHDAVFQLIGDKSEPLKNKPKKKRAPSHSSKKSFYASWEWAQLRYEALQLHGKQCMCCGWTPAPGKDGHLCVDHIKPRSKFPELELDLGNMQILCSLCNRGKSNIHQDDFREEWHGEDDPDEVDPLTAQFSAIMQ